MPGSRADPPKEPFQILALAGGGYLGLYTACVLSELERLVGRPLGRYFDLIGGTSIGGVLALALAFELPARRVVDLFFEHGARVFSSRALPSGPVGRLWDLSRSITGPKYDGVALRKALVEYFDDRTLGDALHHVVIPSVNVTRSVTKVFKTPHAILSHGDADLRAVDVAMATCAAPTYFPAVAVGGEIYADGGLFAVAPDLVAFHEAHHFMGVAEARIRMLSIGTATAGYYPPDDVGADDGAVSWLSAGRLVLTMISVQQQHVQAIMEDQLRERYVRLDANWPQFGGLGIDVATEEAADILLKLAEQTVRELPMAQLSPFLDHEPRASA